MARIVWLYLCALIVSSLAASYPGKRERRSKTYYGDYGYGGHGGGGGGGGGHGGGGHGGYGGYFGLPYSGYGGVIPHGQSFSKSSASASSVSGGVAG